MTKVAVVGAGISGLVVAHNLVSQAKKLNRPIEVIIFEAGPKPGGVIQTQRKDGFLWEEGPDSFLTEKPEALALCQELGLASDLVGTDPRFQKSYVAWKNTLHATPEGFYLFYCTYPSLDFF